MNQIISALIFITLLWTTLSWAEDDFSLDEQAVEFLEGFDFDELREIEVSLDEVFDVFDGLVKKRRTKVASGLKQSTQRTPAVTSVITAQDIEVMGARSLDEALRSVPGLHVSVGWGNSPVYTLRGISSYYADRDPELLVLVNGIRLNDNYQGNKESFWGGFPISMVQRIEIIRGPGSALYGADAFAGVINIMTKTATDIDGTELGVRFGNYNTQDAWVLHGREWNGFEISLMADFNTTDGHQQIVESDAQTQLDRRFGTQASLAPGEFRSELDAYDLFVDISKQHWQWRARYHRANKGSGIGTASALEQGKTEDIERIHTDLTYNNPILTDNWGIEAQLSYADSRYGRTYQIYPPGAFGGTYPMGLLGQPYSAETQTQLSLTTTYRGFKNHLLRLGGGYAYFDLYEVRNSKNSGLNPFTNRPIPPTQLLDVTDTSAAFMPEVSRKNQFIFIQDTWTIHPQWELTAGIRHDHYSDFGSTTNPRLGLVWLANANLIAKLLYGRAFRAPSFAEQYIRNNPVISSSPDLKPEKIETWELAFDYQATDTMHLALNLFHSDVTDRVGAIPEPNTARLIRANVGEWAGMGGEFELRWKTSNKSSLLFNISYQDLENQMTGDDLYNAPQQMAYLRTDYLLGSQWYLNGQINWTGDWTRKAGDPRPDVDGNTTVDLILRRKDIRADKLNFAIGVRNLFDDDVRYPSPSPDANGVINVPNDLPGPGRFYFMELRYKF